MKWNDVRKLYKDKWILFEAIEAYSKDGMRIVEDMAVINVYENRNDALKEYAERHKKEKSRELYVYNTSNEELTIEERAWIGVRKNG
ncbi:hypothetical protein [Haloimpatiens lingqiaonensis]|uniref:hypothetical protein n=1 Tax=Haloimpatiens lingqiaonensis TaxID=1380675 RepID=UPI0010FD3A2C|nr:hypothetical protein [Haloimpatiens lingqiaonensis]